MAGLRELCELAGVELDALDQLLHGTTVATNIVLERNGSQTGMITTRGFRDLIYIGRHRRPKTFSIYQDLPWREPTLVERRLRLPVTERMVPPGEVHTPLDEDEVREAVRKLREEKVDAVASASCSRSSTRSTSAGWGRSCGGVPRGPPRRSRTRSRRSTASTSASPPRR